MKTYITNRFEILSEWIAGLGKLYAFMAAFGCGAWAVTGPLFDYSTPGADHQHRHHDFTF